MMRAIMSEQERESEVVGPDGKKVKTMVPMAMGKDLVTVLQLIARRGARGRNLKLALKLWELSGKVFRVPPGQTGAEPQAPILARFIRSPDAPVVEEPSTAEPEAGVRANGKEYVG